MGPGDEVFFVTVADVAWHYGEATDPENPEAGEAAFWELDIEERSRLVEAARRAIVVLPWQERVQAALARARDGGMG